MSFEQDGHFMTFFCARSVRPPSRVLSLMKVWPEKALSKQALQKLCAQGVVRGRVITFRQIMQLNSAKQSDSF